MSGKYSTAWRHFVDVANDPNKKMCNHCKNKISVRGGSTGNLTRHLATKHRAIQLREERQTTMFRVESDEEMLDSILTTNTPTTTTSTATTSAATLSKAILSTATTSTATTATTLTATTSATISTSEFSARRRNVQMPISNYGRPKISKNRKNLIDEKILKWIVKDLQPFSTIESEYFKDMVKILDPSYQIPTRKTFTKNYLPALYIKTKELVMNDLEKASAISITTDAWTSSANESYIALTAHYCDMDTLKLKSVMLECLSTTESHTAINLSTIIRKCLENFKIGRFVKYIVSDSAANIKSAIEMMDNRQHVACFAHKLNLIVQSALKEIDGLHKIIKKNVAHFKRSTLASQMLIQTQTNLGVECPVKLKIDSPTRWNSTLYMFERCLKVKEALHSTIFNLNNNNLELITNEQWDTLQLIVNILKVYEEMTTTISAEKTITISMVIYFVNELHERNNEAISNYTKSNTSYLSFLRVLKEKTRYYFNNIEDNPLYAEASLLDPRFKAFATTLPNVKNHIHALKNKCQTIANNNRSAEPQPRTEITTSSASGLFAKLQKYSNNLSGLSSSSSAISIIEVDKYLAETTLNLEENPLQWWENRKLIYPNLYILMQRRLCVVATSVSSERIFSKAGLTITDRRTRLSGNNVNQILFLNCNLDLNLTIKQ